MLLSATIITLNEEKNIANAIQSLGFADEIIVVDSFSTDRTVELAKEHGAKVVCHEFRGHGEQKNFAASLCQGEYILNLDADERVTKDLAKEIISLIKDSTNSTQLYGIPRLNHYLDKPIRYGGWYPDIQYRLAKRDQCAWTTPRVHEKLVIRNKLTEQGDNSKSISQLKSPIYHYSFPTIASQVHTNVFYAELGAEELLKKKNKIINPITLVSKPIIKFIECFILKRGFLDGLKGFIIAVNAGHSVFLKYAYAITRTRNASKE